MNARSNTRWMAALLLASPTLLHAQADAGSAEDWWPDRGFVQLGIAPDSRTLTAGAIWAWSWREPWAGGSLGGYWEASFGRWASDLEHGRRATAWITQLGVTPVLRWMPSGSRWFFEAGIGANLLMPIYRSKDKRFSTTFNFGDHLALGLQFGDGHRQEIALRVQHYSNASIRRPNPGEDFVQLRYSRAL